MMLDEPNDILDAPITTSVGFSGYPDSSEPQRLAAILSQATADLANWEQALERRIFEIDLLNDMDHRLQTCTTINDTCGVASDCLPQLFLSESGVMYHRTGLRNHVTPVVTWGYNGHPTPFPMPDTCWAQQQLQAALPGEHRQALVCANHGYPLPVTYLCVPIIVRDDVRGWLQIWNGHDATQSTEAQATILPAFKQRLVATVTEIIASVWVDLH